MEQNSSLGSQVIVMTRTDFEEAIKRQVAAIVSSSQENTSTSRSASFKDSEERLLSRKEVAEMLHVDYTTLWRWNKFGYLRSHKVGARRVVYHYSEVMELAGVRGIHIK